MRGKRFWVAWSAGLVLLAFLFGYAVIVRPEFWDVVAFLVAVCVVSMVLAPRMETK